jgi:hypothetical protein
MKAWEKRGNKAEDNHLNLLHNSPPAVATIVSTRFSNILILSCLVTILCRPVLILDPSLSLCNKLSHDCQKLQRKIRNIFSSQVWTSIITKKLIPHKEPSIRKKKKRSHFLGLTSTLLYCRARALYCRARALNELCLLYI